MNADGPGDLVVTPLNSWQSVINDGSEPLEYIVIEAFPPAISGRLPRRRPADELEVQHAGCRLYEREMWVPWSKSCFTRSSPSASALPGSVGRNLSRHDHP
jgi:hypothetical protein